MIESIIIGGHALWVHGWTSQIHRLMEIARPDSNSFSTESTYWPAQPGMRFFPRPRHVMDELARDAIPMNGMLLASPLAALADMIVMQGAAGLWLPGIEDLDEDCLEGRLSEVMAAMRRIHGRQVNPVPDLLQALTAFQPHP
ncbi:hypothetical protein ACEUZ9_000914 [Paracoccus litorisediminis]|uniref:hypothetical protein n=1 Tax=Paracoccus litorisediminis TaxID=2006130 RepID=UPI00373186F2